MKTRLFVASLMLLAALAVIPPVARAQKVDQSSKVKTVPVQQIAERVDRLIKEVEDSTEPCETRNGIVRRLRLLDDALRSGRRSAARSMALAWRQHAWSQQAARVIGPELGSSLQNQLGGMVDEIGFGWPDKLGPTRHWQPLPSCESSTGVASSTGVLALASGNVVGSYNPTATDPSADVKIFLDMMLGMVPEVGGIMTGLVNLMWPQGPDSDDNVFRAVDQVKYDLVKDDVRKFGYALMGDPKNPQAGCWNQELQSFYDFCDANGGRDSKACFNSARLTLWTQWNSLNGDIVNTYVLDFLKTDDEADEGKDLLPLYAQFQNLYMTFLRDGIFLHNQYWGDRTDLDEEYTAIDLNIPPNSLDQQLDPTIKGYGVGYINDVYIAGLPSGDWATTNAYIRGMTLNVLDYRDTWKFMDPRRYPNPIPGGVKLTRMIYSDPTGTIPSSPNFPSNVPGPLKETSVWTTNYNPALGVNYLVIDAVQATSPPLLGPAQSGAVTGDTTQPANHAHYNNLAALGPIIEVEAQIEPHFSLKALIGYFPRWIGFDYATGTSAQTTAGHKDSGLGVCEFPLAFGCYTAIKYDGEVLATAQSGGESYNESQGVVFGFRFADSFSPAGQAIGVASGKCIDLSTSGTQVVINSCHQPPTPTQIWTYDANLQQISVTNPAEWSKTDPTSSGKHCLDAPDGSAVVISACDDGALTYDANGNSVKSSQLWTIDAAGDGIGKITSVKFGLVVTASSATDGAGLTLASDSGGHPTPQQQWHAPDPSTGEIHGVGSGRCLDVPGASTTVGTQVQINDCDGTDAQQWTYNTTNKELIYAALPTLCLEARGGGTAPDTPVQINTCTGAAEQRWTLHEISFSINQGGGGTITNDKSGLPLSVPHGYTANNTLVNIDTANGTEMQQWSRTSSQGGALHAVGAGKCLTVPQWTAGTQPVIQTCASPLSATQIWTYHPIAQTFTIAGPSGTMCLTGYGFSLSIDGCTGWLTQRWLLDFQKQTITGLYTGLVLDVSGGGTADGTPVLLYMLHDPVSSNQQWVWPLY